MCQDGKGFTWNEFLPLLIHIVPHTLISCRKYNDLLIEEEDIVDHVGLKTKNMVRLSYHGRHDPWPKRSVKTERAVEHGEAHRHPAPPRTRPSPRPQPSSTTHSRAPHPLPRRGSGFSLPLHPRGFLLLQTSLHLPILPLTFRFSSPSYQTTRISRGRSTALRQPLHYETPERFL